LLFCYTFFQFSLLAENSLEKKIKNLELEVIEFERKTIETQKKQRKAASSRDFSPEKKNRKPKEMVVVFPEYDPMTRKIAVKDKNEEISAPLDNSIVAKNSSLEQTQGKFTTAQIMLSITAPQNVGTEQIKLDESGNLIVLGRDNQMIEKNIGERQSVSNIDTKEKKKVITFFEEQRTPVEKKFEVKIKTFDIINKMETAID
jgi:hypothetical protein